MPFNALTHWKQQQYAVQALLLWQSPPVSSSFQIGQLTLERSDLVLLLSERSAKLLNLACPAKQSAMLTGAGLVRPF